MMQIAGSPRGVYSPAQLNPRPKEPRFSSRNRNTKTARDRGEWKFLDIAEKYYASENPRHVRDLPLNRSNGFAAYQLALGIRHAGVQLAHAGRGRVLMPIADMTRSRSQQHYTLIRHDPKEPAGEFRDSPELIQMLEGLQIGVLHFLFSLGPIPQHVSRKLEALSVMASNKLSERFLVISPGASD